jgi:4-hydroxybenzoate polyprenyltransferase
LKIDSSPARALFQLLRPANVATALADVLAGYAVAGAGRSGLAWLLGATACLYAGGIVLNDVFDREIDRVERPERPIPDGRIGAPTAATLGAGLLAAGVMFAAMANRQALLVAILIVGAVLLYDSWTKRLPVGPANMGLCRALNLLLGVAAAPGAVLGNWPLALVPLVYIAAVTALSRGEVHGGRRGIAAFALISLTLVLIALAVLSGSAFSWAGLALTVVLGWRVLPPFAAAWREPGAPQIRRAIRTGVLSLVILDAVIGTTYGGPLYGVLILATGIVAGALARVFAVT